MDPLRLIAQQLEELKDQVAAARAESERLRKELASKDEQIARLSLPRLIKLRSRGDVGYVDMDDVKTVRQRLADREMALKELKDMTRPRPTDKPTEVPGQKLREHKWRMTAIDLPTPEWQILELEREARYGILEKVAEIERSPPSSPGRCVLAEKHVPTAATCLKRPESRGAEPKLEAGLPHTPQHDEQPQPLRQRAASSDRKPAAPRHDTVMRSVEAQLVPFGNTTSHNRGAQMLANRKPVCVHCWDDRQWCDSLALCGNCSASGDKCIYKLCRSGARCVNSRCLYMHPDQWNEQDSTWRVEEGSLRPKWGFDPRKRLQRRSLESEVNPRERHAGGSAKKRDRSPSGPDTLEDGWIRKSVCVHCFDTSSFCDFNGRCRPCWEAGIKCVRIHCKQGLSCRARKCPCVHPGQYDLRDTTWNVEHGDLWHPQKSYSLSS